MPADTTDEDVMAALRKEGIDAASIRPIEPSIEDVFVTLTRRLAHR